MHGNEMEDGSMSERLRYSMLIQWSDEDQAYVVRLPEWEQAGIVHGNPVTHGNTYQEAARNGQEALEALVGALSQRDQPLPEAQIYASRRSLESQ